MHYQKLEGIIINRRGVRDADRFLTIFTRDAGKLSVYAKSVRSIKSKRASSLDLFSHIRFEMLENHDRHTLTSVELLDGHHTSKGSLHNISRLFQLGELVDALTAEADPHPDVYDLLATAITHLHRFATPDYLWRFKKKLLHLLGYGSMDLHDQDLDAYINSLLSRPLRAKIIL